MINKISPRVVLDTNVLVSAVLLADSTPRQAFDQVLQRGILLASRATVTELNEVLRRPGFDKYVLQHERLEFFAALIREAEFSEPTERVVGCRDPKDDKFLELAVGAGATHIVTGDQDLLALSPFRGIAIVRPGEFVEQLRDT